MRCSSHRSLSLVAVALAAGVAFAGTPLPDPPFSNGGFVPPDSIVFKQETSVGKIITKYLVTVAKCDMKAVNSLQLAYEPANQGKVPEVQQAWVDCRAKAELRYTVSRDKVLLKGTPACLDGAGIDALRAVVDGQVAVQQPSVFCDGDAAAPDPTTGLNVPDFQNEANGEVLVAKVLVKVRTAVEKCYTRAALYATRF